MKLLAASLASILTVLLLNLIIVLIPIFIAGAPIYWNQILFLSYWVLVVAAIIVILIGIPTYLLLNRRGRATNINLAIVGFIIPVVTFTVINVSFGPSGRRSAGHTYYGTYRAMVVEGERTIWGWLSFLEQGIIFGICGAVAAAIFGFTVDRLSSKIEQA